MIDACGLPEAQSGYTVKTSEEGPHVVERRSELQLLSEGSIKMQSVAVKTLTAASHSRSPLSRAMVRIEASRMATGFPMPVLACVIEPGLRSLVLEGCNARVREGLRLLTSGYGSSSDPDPSTRRSNSVYS